MQRERKEEKKNEKSFWNEYVDQTITFEVNILENNG